MKILVISEGPSELGASPDTSSLVQLTKRLISDDEIDFTCRRVSDPAVHIHRPRGKHADYERRALGWVRFAERERFDALVFVIDQDGKSERQTGIENAQTHSHFSLPRAMGVAIRTYDAWFLADERALTSILGHEIKRQKQPERLKAPKDVVQKLLSEQDGSGAAKFYFELAGIVDLERLTERCPKGFAPFRSRVESLSPP